MFDLVSTRHGVDPQTVRCAQLLACVIADAVRHAGTKPSPEEQRLEMNIDSTRAEGGHPGLSTWFLFDDASPFKDYARLIGIDPQALRDALLSDRPLNDTFRKSTAPAFTFAQRRAIKARHKFYLRQKLADAAAAKSQQEGAIDGVQPAIHPTHQAPARAESRHRRPRQDRQDHVRRHRA